MSISIRQQHISELHIRCGEVRSEHELPLELQTATMSLIGTSLSALYQAATCYRQCFNNGHVLEALCGRAYNLGVASFELIKIGLYDEALNLIRSIAEIGNLIGMSAQDKNALHMWLTCNDKDRRNKFTPAKIREILKKANSPFIVANDDWYSRFCEKYTHVAPSTRAGAHGHFGKDWVGPVFQKEGLDLAIDELENVLVRIAIMICAYFKFDDLIQDIKHLIKILETNENS